MNNELLSLVPDYLPLSLILYDKEGYLTYANNIALDTFGAIAEEVYGIINIFDDPNITPEDKALLKQGQSVSFETDYDFDLCGEQFFDTNIRGVRKYFLTKVAIMHNEAGQLKGYLLTCEDVTEKKAQERKIKLTQEELGMALNAGKLTSWNYRINEGVFAKFDIQIENIEQHSLTTIRESIHPDERESFINMLDAIINKKQKADGDFVLQVKEEQNPDYRYYSFLYNARQDDKGNINAITFIKRDITEDLQYQQELIEAKNKAEEADNLKTTFLANMSHEIRTPLNAIVGFSALISETEEAEEKNEYRQLIETNSEILLKLIGDILDLSKIEAGSININREELDLSLLCTELYKSFQQRIKNPKLTLRFINPYATCKAYFDKDRFRQLFTNFLSNAIKYTPEGEIVMGYECTPGQVRLYVRDTGIGIAKDKQNNIFGRFEKVDTFAQGTGLGLSICKAIADATASEIGFDSEEGVGSEFWYVGYTDVEYVEKDTTTDTTVKYETYHQEESPKVTVKNLHILVAEDNNSNYRLIENVLKDNNLTRAIHGADAVEKARTQRFDLILMDIRMPIMNGLEATHTIRTFNQEIPIVALTANAFHTDREAALAAGCNHFMTKPLKRQELQDFLSHYFG